MLCPIINNTRYGGIQDMAGLSNKYNYFFVVKME